MLNTTQKSALTALRFKPLSITALAKQMTVAKALAESLSVQLVELGLATKYDNGQFTISPKGKDYLAGKLAETVTSQANAPASSDESLQRHINLTTQGEALDLATKVAQLSAVPGSLETSDMTCVSEFKDPVVADVPKDSLEALLREEADAPADAAVIPEPVTAALLNLEQRLNRKIPAPAKLELKLAVLHRLALLMDPSISEVLEQISDDLTTLQQSAAA
jgi:predicted transcriptional regulator